VNVLAVDETAGETTYRLIRSNILLGKLRPGSKLKLERLRADYRTSVSTLREILSRLTSEKLVVAEGQRGFEVAPISEADLRETADLRLLLEGDALAHSFANGDLEWEGLVVSAHHKLALMEQEMNRPGTAAVEMWKRYDWQFHQALISACGSRLLMQTHATVFDRYLRYQMIALGNRGEIAAREHRELLDAALARDTDLAVRTLRDHVNGGVAQALASGTIEPRTIRNISHDR
jgi:DNA-binding GntR family transcriptional regulator